jgi:serine/threonine-protein kinase
MDENLINEIREILPHLKITGEIKRGGQKVVFSAYFKNNKRAVFKIINPSDVEDENRAIQEIQICSNFNSIFFANLYDYGRYNYKNDSVIYVVEEFITGSNLRDLLANALPNILPIQEIRRIINSLLMALEIIEKSKLVHRDIKPENVIVNDDRVVLIDFGIARQIDQKSITNSYAIFGPMTPGYAPPEQIRNEKRKISIRTDLFSLGILFYELLTGYKYPSGEPHLSFYPKSP